MKRMFSVNGPFAAVFGVMLLGVSSSNPTAYLYPSLRTGQTIVQSFRSSFGSEGVHRSVSTTIRTTVKSISGVTARLSYSASIGDHNITSDQSFDQKNLAAFDAQGAPKTIHSATYIFYSTFLFGTPPSDFHVGSHWTVHLGDAWQLGPPGDQVVEVVSIDDARHSVVLHVHGHGVGPSETQIQHPPVTTGSIDGKSTQLTTDLGETTWDGVFTIRDGLTESSTMKVNQKQVLEK